MLWKLNTTIEFPTVQKVFLRLLNQFWLKKGHHSQTFLCFFFALSLFLFLFRLNNVYLNWTHTSERKFSYQKENGEEKKLSFNENNRQSFSDEIFPLLVVWECLCVHDIVHNHWSHRMFYTWFGDTNGKCNTEGKKEKKKKRRKTNMTKWMRKRKEGRIKQTSPLLHHWNQINCSWKALANHPSKLQNRTKQNKIKQTKLSKRKKK